MDISDKSETASDICRRGMPPPQNRLPPAVLVRYTWAVLELAQARIRVRSALIPLPAEPVPLSQAAGRFLRQEVLAPMDLPGFDNSAVDGYAVRAVDLAEATPATPVELPCVGAIAAGESSSTPLAPGHCLRVFTGSAVPPGTDAVVMQEDTAIAQGGAARIVFRGRVRPATNIRCRGRDIQRGQVLLAPGQRLGAGQIAALAALGIARVEVGRQPVVGLLATGSELRAVGQTLGPGQVYESNRAALTVLCAEVGAKPRLYPPVPDTAADTMQALSHAFDECDLVVSSGGVSVGDKDHVRDAFTALGGRLDFWQVNVRPGKPFVFGGWRGKWLMGLPGNPVSAFVTCVLLVQPALQHLQGDPTMEVPGRLGHLAEALTNDDERPHFMRVQCAPTAAVRSSGLQASHALSSLLAANGLVEVPARTTLPVGALVQVLGWRGA
ncbi:MAG: molybdopterin molybdotransferase MoeA [Verrucomicrobia bacterium]|nr:molybdopterin molybdotransferase MoeA [Verrucomicrobiota bacterium]